MIAVSWWIFFIRPRLRASILEQSVLFSVGNNAEVIIGQLGGHSSPGSAVEKAYLDQKRFVNFFNSFSFLRQRRGQRIQSDWAALIFFDDCQHELAVNFIE